MTLKRAGRGHDPEGIGSTRPGSLTVECPACPHPGQNIPENWREAGPLMYVMFSFLCSEILIIGTGFFIFCMFLSMQTSS